MTRQYLYFLMLFGLILGLHIAREGQSIFRSPAAKGEASDRKLEVETYRPSSDSKPALWVEPISADQK